MKKHKNWPSRLPKPSQYNWDEILDGDVNELVRGEDFDCTAESMRGNIIYQARERGIPVQTRTQKGSDGEPDRVFVQAQSPNGEVAAHRARVKAGSR